MFQQQWVSSTSQLHQVSKYINKNYRTVKCLYLTRSHITIEHLHFTSLHLISLRTYLELQGFEYLHTFGLTDNLMCPCEEEEEQSTDHLTFQGKKLHNQRNEIIKQIKHTGGNWPMTNETLVNIITTK